MRRTLLAIVVAAIAGAAGSASVSAQAPYYADPGLVTVAPGVQVIADYDVPIFYANHVYWRFYANRWWRSPYYNRGWAYGVPPRAVLGIPRPYSYVHYRPPGWRGRPYARGYYRRY